MLITIEFFFNEQISYHLSAKKHLIGRRSRGCSGRLSADGNLLQLDLLLDSNLDQAMLFWFSYVSNCQEEDVYRNTSC